MNGEMKPEELQLKEPNEKNQKSNPEDKYPWHLLVRTFVFLNAFLGKFGMNIEIL